MDYTKAPSTVPSEKPSVSPLLSADSVRSSVWSSATLSIINNLTVVLTRVCRDQLSWRRLGRNLRELTGNVASSVLFPSDRNQTFLGNRKRARVELFLSLGLKELVS